MSTKISDYLKYMNENRDYDHVAIKLQLLTLVDVDAGDFESFGHYASSAKRRLQHLLCESMLPDQEMLSFQDFKKLSDLIDTTTDTEFW